MPHSSQIAPSSAAPSGSTEGPDVGEQQSVVHRGSFQHRVVRVPSCGRFVVGQRVVAGEDRGAGRDGACGPGTGGTAERRRLRRPGRVARAGQGRGGARRAAASSGATASGRITPANNQVACDADVVVLAVQRRRRARHRPLLRRPAPGQDRRLDGEPPREARQRVQRGPAAARLDRQGDAGAALALRRS